MLYLTPPRILLLLGMIDPNSPTAITIGNYITTEFSDIYSELINTVVGSKTQQQYIFKNFIGFFGKTGLEDILIALSLCNYSADRQLQKWDRICKKNGLLLVDFELVRVYKRYLDLDVLSHTDKEEASAAILGMNMNKLASVLNENFKEFEDSVVATFSKEKGQDTLLNTSTEIFNNIQYKLSQVLGDAI